MGGILTLCDKQENEKKLYSCRRKEKEEKLVYRNVCEIKKNERSSILENETPSRHSLSVVYPFTMMNGKKVDWLLYFGFCAVSSLSFCGAVMRVCFRSINKI